MRQKWILLSFFLVICLHQAWGQKDEVFTIKNEKLVKKENSKETPKPKEEPKENKTASKPAVVNSENTKPKEVKKQPVKAEPKPVKEIKPQPAVVNTVKKAPVRATRAYKASQANGDFVQYAYFDGEMIVTTYAPRIPGQRFKIQIGDSSILSLSDDLAASLSKFGRLDTEYILDDKSERYLIGDFMTSVDAEKVIADLSQNGIKVQGIHSYLNGIRTD